MVNRRRCRLSGSFPKCLFSFLRANKQTGAMKCSENVIYKSLAFFFFTFIRFWLFFLFLSKIGFWISVETHNPLIDACIT